MNKLKRIALVIAIALTIVTCTSAQTKNFTPVDGASLKAKIDNAVTQGRAGSQGGRFWVGYQFEARPGVAIDFEVVDSNGGVYFSMDGTSMTFDSRYETRELGLFLLFDTQRDLFTRA